MTIRLVNAKTGMTAIVCAVLLSYLRTCYALCPLPGSVDSSRIVPVVRSSDSAALEFPRSPRTVPTRGINDELVVVFAADTETAISYFLIDESAANCWLGNDVLSASLKNFARLAPSIRVVKSRMV